MLPPNSPTNVAIALNDVRCNVVATRKVAGHTDYAIRVQTDRFGGEDLVYRRFSAFLQLQQLARRHFQDHAVCCGGDKSCLLASCLERVFEDTEFPVMQGRFLGKNSKNVVRERVLFLNAFLLELEEALCKCPPVVMARCEKQGCKITKLLKSFYGCLDVSGKDSMNQLAFELPPIEGDATPKFYSPLSSVAVDLPDNKLADSRMELVTKVRDTEHWAQVLEYSEKKLVVVDVHKDWCGPCKIVEPTYKRLTTDIDHSERRLLFATLNVGLNVDGVEDTGSCKPRFLFFRDRKYIADVDGANAPQLEQLVKQHVPPLGNDDEEN